MTAAILSFAWWRQLFRVVADGFRQAGVSCFMIEQLFVKVDSLVVACALRWPEIGTESSAARTVRGDA